MDLQAAFGASIASQYAVHRELGCGGMAFVFAAEDLKHHRPVAIKVLRPELTHVLGAERFLREIEIAAGLSHPHILPLYDSGETQGFLYYVMPLVEGESLRARLDREIQLPIEDALAVTRDLAEALAYAHTRGIIHRDIKPENILFVAGHAVLTDFGIAKAVTAAAKTNALTAAGLAVGTAAYMSPEQAAGDPTLDARSDLYSLGCVAFEMIAGEPPFTGPTARAVIAKRFTFAPPDISKLRAGVPIAVSQAITRLLAQAPPDRYETAGELFSALKSIESRTPATQPRDASLAVLPFLNMSADPENEYLSDGITEEIINALSRIDDLRIASRMSSFSFKGQPHDLRAVSAKLNVKHILGGSVRRAGPHLRITVQLVDVERDVTLWSERYNRQIGDIFTVQDEIATTIARRLQAALGSEGHASLVASGTDNFEAYEEYLKGRHFWNQRGSTLARAVPHFQRALYLDPEFVAAYAGLAQAYCSYAIYGLASQAEAYTNAREAIERALTLSPDEADVQYAAGLVEHFFGWNLERAESHFRAAIVINPRHAASWAWLSQLNGYLARIDRVREAVTHAHNADPLSPLINGIAAQGFLYSGYYGEALRCADAILEIDPNHIATAWIRGYCYTMLGRIEDAVAVYEQASASYPSVPALSGLAAAYARAGRKRDARSAIRKMAATTDGNHAKWWECLPLVALGCVEQAVNVACVSLQERHWLAWGSGCQPMLEPIAEHHKWQAAMKAVGLEWIVETRLRHNKTIRSFY